ncbi:MAG: TraR/DksA family transcriptional regulator [Sinobacterium sp.]|nr:TraR/DksA family transcriptional regulator [Sinobacterium sp.]
MQYDAIKTQLEAKQAELDKRITAINKDLQKQHSSTFSEQASERENEEVLNELASEAKSDLNQIKTALKRIENKQYGICSSCGDDINEQRLLARPEAVNCIKCAA